MDLGEGDLALFAFALAGATGGLAAGYAWRMLVSERRPGAQDRTRERTSPAAKD